MAVDRRSPIGVAVFKIGKRFHRTYLAESHFHGEGHRKVWAKLRRRGIRTDSERARRLMREHRLQAPAAGPRSRPRAHDGTAAAEEPDVIWGPP